MQTQIQPRRDQSRVWPNANREFHQRHLIPTVKHGSGGGMVSVTGTFQSLS